jgi:hypothetical protein
VVTFVVCAPPYSDKSAGCVMLHDLCDGLVRLGHKAHIALMINGGLNHSNDATHYKSGHLWTPWPDERMDAYVPFLQSDAIVVYPEIISGNPLGAKNIARYFLNKSGAISGVPVDVQETDYVIAYSRSYYSNPKQLLYRIACPDTFHDRDTAHFADRKLDLSYVGKGAFYTACGKVRNTTEITRDWPAEKADLLGLLRSCRYFFSWDDLSGTNLDAALCGAVPVLLNFGAVTPTELDAFEIPLPYLRGHWIDGEVYFPRVGSEFLDKRAALFAMREQLNAAWMSGVQAFSLGAIRFFH